MGLKINVFSAELKLFTGGVKTAPASSEITTSSVETGGGRVKEPKYVLPLSSSPKPQMVQSYILRLFISARDR